VWRSVCDSAASVCLCSRSVQAALFYPALDGNSIWTHLQAVEDTDALRQALPGVGLVGFVGNGAILPRKRWELDA
jgi:predicted ABC-class ATPase